MTTLLAAGAALVEITLRAVEYLPDLIEVMVDASHIAFVYDGADQMQSQVQPDYLHKSDLSGYQHRRLQALEQADRALIPFSVSPKMLPQYLRDKLVQREWQGLIYILAYDFDVQLNSGNIPEKLKDQILFRKKRLEVALMSYDHKTKIDINKRPFFSRIIDR